jgi:GAF domain-containing protein
MPGDSPPLTNEQEHLRLLAALRESEILRELAELLASSLDLDSILKVLVKRTTEVCEVERCAVWLLEDARGVLRPATYHLSSQHIDAKSSRLLTLSGIALLCHLMIRSFIACCRKMVCWL